MTLSASERIDQILCGKQIHPLDFLNCTIHYDPRLEPGSQYSERLVGAAKFSYVVANEMGHGLNGKLAFRASGMSNGTLAYDLVNDIAERQRGNIYRYTTNRFGVKAKTTQNLKNTVAKSELENRVIFPNREADYRAANELEAAHPDLALVYPIGWENTVRMQKASNALSQGATFQDQVFESWWVPRLIDMSHKFYDGQKRFDSRNLHAEDNIGNFIQLGYLDEYRTHVVPGKKMPITDRNGVDVPLADRAWGRAKHVFERTEEGFATDFAVNVLLGEFMIDDWLRGKSEPVGFPAPDKRNIHPVLAKRAPQELERMDRLKAMMLPYIAAKCMDFNPLYQEDPNLKKYIEETIFPAADKFSDLNMVSIREALFSEDIVGDMNVSDIRPKKEGSVAQTFEKASAPDTIIGKPVKRRDTDGLFFKTRSRMFEDNHYDKLSLWEQAMLPFAMGAAESFRLPENAPRSLFYVAEPKGGARAKAYKKKHKIDYLKEAYGAEDQVDPKSPFLRDVIEKNRRQISKDVNAIAKSEIAKSREAMNIVSTENFLNIAAAAQKYRHFVAADGPQKLSPRGRLALMTEWLRRNPTGLVVRKDWAVHHDESQMVLEALKVATGLVKRPYNGGDYKMEIFTIDEKTKALEKQDLYDLIVSLGREVDTLLDTAPAREHFVTMARILRILDAYMDPGRMNYKQHANTKTGATEKEEIIHWREADPVLMAFWHDEPKKKAELVAFRNHLREKLLDIGVLYFEPDDLVDLDEDYTAAWNRARGLNEQEIRKKYEGQETFHEWRGPV